MKKNSLKNVYDIMFKLTDVRKTTLILFSIIGTLVILAFIGSIGDTAKYISYTGPIGKHHVYYTITFSHVLPSIVLVIIAIFVVYIVVGLENSEKKTGKNKGVGMQ